MAQRGGSTPEPPTLYFKRGCSGCDVARRWLAKQGIQVREREMFREPLSATEIEDLVGDRPITYVLSTRTTQYAARGLKDRPHSEAELLRHMEAEPRLIRRPLIKAGETLLVGFDAARWEEALVTKR
ncbi:MAG TPA: ArsC/Spx/MgsR family protein [Chloroflexota bacterium]|nr:ArsC/Spx/MgsR family protein [Chloroflexota bacterium]